jgi:REJ domain
MIVYVHTHTYYEQVLSPGAFAAGGEYTLTLTCTDTRTGAVGAASFILVFNAPPQGGLVTSSLTSATAASDVVTLSATAWSDATEDLPLVYSFSYVHGVVDLHTQQSAATASSLIPLSTSSFGTYNTWSGVLPLGLPENGYNITGMIVVTIP